VISGSRKYLEKVLQKIQEINPSLFQTIILPVAPLDPSITFREDYLERVAWAGHYIFSDADSVLLPAENVEN